MTIYVLLRTDPYRVGLRVVRLIPFAKSTAQRGNLKGNGWRRVFGLTGFTGGG